MERNYQYQVIHVPNSRIRGIIPTHIVSNPECITLAETCDEANSNLLSLWQTLNHMPDALSIGDNKDAKFEGYIFTLLGKDSNWRIRFYDPTRKILEYPLLILESILARLTLNPSEFLILPPEKQAEQLKLIEAKLSQEPSAEDSYLLPSFTKVGSNILFEGYNFKKTTLLGKIRFSLAVGMVLKPHHKIIRITDWMLLNPSYMDHIINMVMERYHIWITTDTYRKMLW